MNKTKKMEKGITLIALIITIVVLLILAVVTIREVQDDGIIKYAKKATADYEKAQKEEQDALDSISSMIDEATGNGWKQTGTDIVYGNDESKKLTVGDKITFTPSDTASADSYTGGWQLLGIENGKLLLISEGYIKDGVSFNGTDNKDDWNSTNYTWSGIEDKLNEMCKNAVDITGTKAESVRSVKVEDINKVTGYNPNKSYSGYGESINYTWNGTNVTYKRGDKTNTVEQFILPDGRKLGENNFNEIKFTDNYYYTGGDDSIENLKGTNAYNILFQDKAYWLASSCIEDADGNALLRIRGVMGGNIGAAILWKTKSGALEENMSGGVRAVVTLKSTAELIKSEDGSYSIK